MANRFSQRKGLTPIRVEIQRESIDDPLRNKLWTAILLCFFEKADRGAVENSNFEWVMKRLWIHFFDEPLDTLPLYWIDIRKLIREQFFKYEWYEIYNFIEALAQELKDDPKQKFIELVDSFLESEMSAYRFVDDEIGEFTSETEIKAIESAIADTQNLQTVHAHLHEALSKLTDRTNPDYRNSIKESISAVEAICQLITKSKKATLGEAIKKLKDTGVNLHPALEKAWSNIYGYTSDEGGIRHALSDLDSSQITFGTAKYMLVSCSAFISYLLDLAREVKITLTPP